MKFSLSMGVAWVSLNLLNWFKLNWGDFCGLTNPLQLQEGKFCHYIHIHAGENMHTARVNHIRIWLYTKPRPSFRCNWSQVPNNSKPCVSLHTISNVGNMKVSILTTMLPIFLRLRDKLCEELRGNLGLPVLQRVEVLQCSISCWLRRMEQSWLWAQGEEKGSICRPEYKQHIQ